MRLGRADAVRVPGGIALQSRFPGMRLALAGRLRLVLGRLPAAVSTMPGSLSGLNTAASLSVRSFLSVRLGNAAITGVPRRTLLQFTSQGVRLVLQLQLSRLLRSSKEEIWYRQLTTEFKRKRFFKDICKCICRETQMSRKDASFFFLLYNNNDILIICFVKCI